MKGMERSLALKLENSNRALQPLFAFSAFCPRMMAQQLQQVQAVGIGLLERRTAWSQVHDLDRAS